MARETRNNPPGAVIKRSNIRIWCHDCDMARLQRIVWDGHGARLLSEVSNQPVVKKFFEAVPYIMNTIRELHTAVVQNDLENVMKHAGDPIPPVVLSSRDNNNMTVFHKAAGLGHGGILRYICERYPQGINDLDNDGRTPLHYAAAVKDDQHTYNTLVGLGADESIMDNKHKTPAYYINRSQEIDRSSLKVIPDAPRTPSSAYPSSWDWRLLDTEVIAELNKKSRRKGFKQSTENISSNTMTDNTENFTNTMKTSSTQELIKDLPELDEHSKSTKHNDNEKFISKESEEVEEQKEPETIDEEPEVTEETEKKEVDEVNKMENDDLKVEEKVEEIDNVDKNDEEEHVNEQEEAQKEHESVVTENSNDEEDKEESNDEAEIKVNDESVNIEKKEDLHTENDENNEIHDTKNSKRDDTKNDVKDENKDEESEEDKTEQNEDEKSYEDKPKTPEVQNDDVGSDTKNENNETKVVEDEGGITSLDANEQAQGAESADAPSEGNQSNGRNTQDSLIEGVINGDVDVDTEDASVSQRDASVHGDVLIVDNEIDPEVTELINSVNMEMLAALVLNGEGARLVGRHSSNAELEAFLENVPAYMKKIHKVHMAAREGNIRDLQAALDRRKFAIARDPISPNGATPLHVATIFGKTNIIKYLGGRFPETLSAVDFEGRTALHYAAILPDNGHYYNLLQQLGANSKDLDDNGHSAEEYFRKKNLMSLDQLFSDFGVTEDVVKNMLSDKVPGDHVSSRRTLDAPEAIDTLERCYRLLSTSRSSMTPLSASSNKSTPSLVLGRFLRKNVFEAIKGRITKLDHDLFDVIWPAVKKIPDNKNIIQTIEDDFSGGIMAPDYYIYAVFNEFLTPLVKDIHNLNIQAELKSHPKSDFIRKRCITKHSSEPLVLLNIDTTDDFVLSGSMECMRNLHGFELPLNLTLTQLKEVERILKAILLQEEFDKCNHPSYSESDQKGGTYYTLNKVLEKPSEVSAMLASSGLLVALCDKEEVDDCTRIHGKHWPIGRGVYVSGDKTIAVWVNVHDHLRVVTATQSDAPGEVGLPFSRLTNIMTYLHSKLEFVWDDTLGYLSCRPTFLGAGIHFSLIVNFPGLAKDVDNLKNLCSVRGLQYRETLSPDIAKITNYQSLNITESHCFNDFTLAMSNLLHLEKDISMQNSAQIATMLSNIFRRKRSGYADSDTSDRYYS